MWTVLLAGAAFGIILQRSRVNTFDSIGGFAMLKDFTVPKVMLTAIAVSSVLLFLEAQIGWASYHIKPFVTVGIVSGGILFGMGMALLGYCPGTLFISASEGSLDAVLGVVVGIVTGALYLVLFPAISPRLGPNLGKLQIHFDSAVVSGLVVVVFAAVLLAIAVALDRRESENAGG